MFEITTLFSVVAGIGLLLVLILVCKLHAFLSLLIVSIVVGILTGMPAVAILDTIKNGMGNTLGFVATVVGLGALFAAMLETTGGAQSLAAWMLKLTGTQRAPWAMVGIGFITAIPIFFDVAFIILVPVAYALQRKTGKSLVLYAMPLLAGLAISHSFIPPTPGPVAVADILGVEIGWVILIGTLIGLPTAILCGPLFARKLAQRMMLIQVLESIPITDHDEGNAPSPIMIMTLILLPISLIVVNTVLAAAFSETLPAEVLYWSALLGHPFSALIIANLLAWYVLGIRYGIAREELLTISTRSMYPTGAIILLTGAGGAFKQVLVDSGAGKMLAESMSTDYFPPVLFAFLIAALVRVLQGSATVAMITAAGITAPLVEALALDPIRTSLLVVAIASGATVLSHVNDSGFWLVKQYLGLSEKQTLSSWTLMTSLIGVCGLILCWLVWMVV